MKGLFVSDLHLFSRRSVGHERWKELEFSLQSASWLVLGGDIFDFRWSTLSTVNATREAAENWIRNLLRLHPHLHINYVTGNHDCQPTMQHLLQEISLSNPKFQWHDHSFRLGDKLFLHGDIIDASSHSGGLLAYRRKFSNDLKSRGKVANLLYDTLVATRAHRLPRHIVHRPKQIVTRLYRYLIREELVADSKLQKIYFGHTHVPMQAVPHQGYLFYNPGSAIRHLPFRPCSFECDQE